MTPYLIIGYGNTLRGDDGAGYRLAETIAQWNFPDVRSLSVHQLTPELAAEIADAQTILFIDAATSPQETPPTVQPLAPHDREGTLQHHADPRSLLALTRALYGGSPNAYQILIPVETFDFGESLSATTAAAIAIALEKIREFVDRTEKT
jgi:hydrogenase maturation protease